MAKSDGKVIIDVILDDGTVAKGVANIDKKLDGLSLSSKKVASSIKGIVTALGLVALASKAIDVLKNSLDGAIARYDTLTSFPVVMQQMGFSADQARKSIDKLSKGIQGLPTTLDSIVANTQRIALLTGDLDLATETALALNNAFLASGSSAADAERGLTQYVQMLSKGTVDMQSWYTLQETMGYALNKTAEAFGYAGASAQRDLYEALQKGTITFEQFNAKLIELSNTTGGFADVARNSTSGIATSFSNLKTAVVRGLANVIAAIDDALGGTGSIANNINRLQKLIDTFFNFITEAIPQVKEFIQSLEPLLPLINTLTGLLIGLGVGFAVFQMSTFIIGITQTISVLALLKSAIETVAIASMLLWDTLMANPVVAIISILAGLAAMFVYLYKTSEPFRNVINSIADVLKNAFAGAVAVASQWLNVLSSAFKTIADNVKIGAINAFNNAVAWLVDVAQKANNLLSSLKDTIASLDFKQIFSTNIGPLVTVMSLMLDIAGPIAWLIKGLAILAFNTSLFSDALSVLKGEMSFGAFIEKFANDLSGLIQSFAENTSKMVTIGSEMAVKIIEGISSQIPTLVNFGVNIITAVINGMTSALSIILPLGIKIIAQLIVSIVSAIPMLLNIGVQIITTIIDAIATNLPMLVEVGIQLINTLISTVVGMLPQFVDTFVKLIDTIVDTIIDMLPVLSNTFTKIVDALIKTIVVSLPLIIDAGVQILLALIKGVLSILPSLLDAAIKIITSLANIIIKNLPVIIEAGIKILLALVDGILKVVPQLLEAAVILIVAIASALIDNLPKIIDAGVKILLALISGIIKVLPQLISAAIRLVVELVAAIIRALPQIISAGGQILLALITGITKLIGQLLKLGGQLVIDLARSIINAIPKMMSAGADLIKGLWQGIKNAKTWLLNQLSGFVTDVVGHIKKAFKIGSPSKLLADEVGHWLPAGVAQGVDNNLGVLKKSAQNMVDAIVPSFKRAITLTDDMRKAVQQQVWVNRDKSLEEQFKALEELANKQKEYYNWSADQEAAYWRYAATAFADGTAAKRWALEKYNEAYEKLLKEQFDAEKSYIDERKKYNQLSLVDELKIYEQYMKQYKAGTEQRKYYEEQVYNMKKAIHEKLSSLNDDYLKKVQDLNSKLIEEERKLNEEYEKQFDSKVKSYYSFAGLFDEVKKDAEVSGQQLIQNLRGQIDVFAEWMNNLKSLGERGIDTGLLDELREMGPKAAAEIAALTTLSDEELNEYVDLWRTKNELAKQQATVELDDLRNETARKISDLHDQTARQLDELRNEWIQKVAEIRTGSINEFDIMNASLQQIGEHAIQGLIDGFSLMEGPLLDKAKTIAESVKDVISAALKIHSPSRWMRDFIAKNMALGWIGGIDRQESAILKKTKEMSEWMKPVIPETFSKLRDFTIPVGRIMPTNSITNSQTTSIQNDNSKSFNPQITNYFTQENLSPSEIARKEKEQMERLALDWGVIG